MISAALFDKLALAFEEAVKEPHFERTSYRVRKKIYATLAAEKKQVVLKLSKVDQQAFCAFDAAAVYPVPGGWGKQGWTIFELPRVRRDMLRDALTVAYCNVAPRKLADKYS